MRFVETTVFTKQIVSLLSDDEYRALQGALILRPEQGSRIRGSGGLRKMRWRAKGSGKRGGIRIIYYWYPPEETVVMLFAYGKDLQDDLTAGQLKALARVVKEEYP